MKTATIELKTDKIGCTVTLHRVTPPQLMFLVADNHQRAGGDPILSLVIEKKQTQGEVPEKDPTGQVVKVNGKPHMIPGLVDTEEDYEHNLSKAQEKNRLINLYGKKRINRLFPGALPAMPETFDEARQAGLGSSTGAAERLISVGEDESQQ